MYTSGKTKPLTGRCCCAEQHSSLSACTGFAAGHTLDSSQGREYSCKQCWEAPIYLFVNRLTHSGVCTADGNASTVKLDACQSTIVGARNSRLSRLQSALPHPGHSRCAQSSAGILRSPLHKACIDILCVGWQHLQACRRVDSCYAQW